MTEGRHFPAKLRGLSRVAEFDADTATRLFEAKHKPLIDVRSGLLMVVAGTDVGLRLPLGPMPVTVGTAQLAHLRLSDPTVSRVHCQLSPRPDGVRLTDAGSTNGTFVDGLRIRDAELTAGANIRVGATTLRLELGTDLVRVPLADQHNFGKLVGGSLEMRRLYAILERVAPTETTVLIQGETGTGKELVARELHDHSERAAGPFVAVDCGAIAPNVIESELFGHVRGAFSGAVGDRRGLFEEANGGTICLDEIGELPLALQAKLLRVLENREVRRVGSNTARPVDVRLLASTNRPLAQSVNEGAFREDLYYRLAVIELVLPPLRARREDVPPLAQHFYDRFSGKREPLPSELLTSLLTRSWPGNVRELRNFIERCVTLGGFHLAPRAATSAESGEFAQTTLGVDLGKPLKEARDDAVERFELLYLETALRRAGGNVTRAAELAGVSRRFLQRTIARLGIRGAASVDDAGDDDAPDSA
jgi:transcriptional regulator with PAS, ATPase and Fis domain